MFEWWMSKAIHDRYSLISVSEFFKHVSDSYAKKTIFLNQDVQLMQKVNDMTVSVLLTSTF